MDQRVLFIIGAGADKSLGFPLMNDLMHDLRAFKHGPQGKAIDAALRKHVKGLQFDFDKYAGDKGTTLGAQLLGGSDKLLTDIKKAVFRDGLTETPQIIAVREVVSRLENIRRENILGEDMQQKLARAEGDLQGALDDHLIDPKYVRFADLPKRMLRGALKEAISDSEPGSKELYDLLLSLSNFEELLGEFFVGFFTKNVQAQKRYFYLTWLFWAYIRLHQVEKMADGRFDYSNSFYEVLTEFDEPKIVTFNYTSYSRSIAGERAFYFHGDNETFLNFRTREIISQPEVVSTYPDVIKYISSLDCSFGDLPNVVVPALIPPLIMKPIIASEYIDWWYGAAKAIEDATHLVICGYSFAFADEHFNDIVRKRAQTAKIVVFDPNITVVRENMVRAFNIENDFVSVNIAGLNAMQNDRVLLCEAKGESVSFAHLQDALRVV